MGTLHTVISEQGSKIRPKLDPRAGIDGEFLHVRVIRITMFTKNKITN